MYFPSLAILNTWPSVIQHPITLSASPSCTRTFPYIYSYTPFAGPLLPGNLCRSFTVRVRHGNNTSGTQRYSSICDLKMCQVEHIFFFFFYVIWVLSFIFLPLFIYEFIYIFIFWGLECGTVMHLYNFFSINVFQVLFCILRFKHVNQNYILHSVFFFPDFIYFSSLSFSFCDVLVMKNLFTCLLFFIFIFVHFSYLLFYYVA